MFEIPFKITKTIKIQGILEKILKTGRSPFFGTLYAIYMGIGQQKRNGSTTKKKNRKE